MGLLLEQNIRADLVIQVDKLAVDSAKYDATLHALHSEIRIPKSEIRNP